MYATSPANDPDALLTELQAAELLSLSSRTLQAWRIRGGGPRFVNAGRAVRYRRRDLIAWVEVNTVSIIKPRGTGTVTDRAGAQ